MKKNTLLYLDENMVQQAKDLGLNLSKICQNAINSELSFLGSGQFNPEDFLNELYLSGSAIFLPIKINYVKIENIGIIKNAEIEFKEKNIIVGGNATGKTTILKSISRQFRNDIKKESNPLSKNQKNGYVKIDINKTDSIEQHFNLNKKNNNYKCLIIDDGIDRLDKENKNKFITYLLKLNIQVILTSNLNNELPSKFNLIKIKDTRKLDIMKDILINLSDMMIRLEKKSNDIDYKISNTNNKKMNSMLRERKMIISHDLAEIKNQIIVEKRKIEKYDLNNKNDKIILHDIL